MVQPGLYGPTTPRSIGDFQMIASAVEPLRQLKAAGFVLIATTNQPGLSLGLQSRRELDLMHQLLRQTFPIDDIFVCAHSEMDGCNCRKPKPGLLFEAAFKWHLDLERSFVISDKWQDAQAAHQAGCLCFLIKSPWNGNARYDCLLPDLDSAAQKILQLQGAATSLVN